MKRTIKDIIRIIKQYPLYSSINTMGLVFGFLCIILISFWIKNELSYDRFHKNSDNIYRFHRYWYDANGTENLHLPFVAPPVAPLVKNDFPEIENIARVSHSSLLFTLGQKTIEERDVCFAEPDILKIFTFEGVDANSNLLVEPLTVIISESMAIKYFESEHAIDNTLEFNDQSGAKYKLRVTGVFKDWSTNSHFRPEFFVSFSTYKAYVGEEELKDWGSNNYETYALIPHLPADINSKLDLFIDKYLNNGTDWTKLRIEKLSDIHFNWFGNRSYIYILFSASLLILFLASINFMNLHSAIYLKRMKEIQIKKVLGASRTSITLKLMLESILFCVLALCLAFMIAPMGLSQLDNIFQNTTSLSFNEHKEMISGLIILSIIVGLLSATYPAFIVLSYKSNKDGVLSQAKIGNLPFRKVLIVFQFFVSIALIMAFITVNKQLNYVQDKSLGFSKENVLTISATPHLIEKLETFRQQLKRNPNILSVTGSKRIPSQMLADSNGANIKNNDKLESVDFRLANIRIDEHFLSTYQMKLIAGKNISDEKPLGAEYLLNQTAINKFGWQTAESALGKFMQYGGRQGKIVGVVEDFHYESLHNSVSPVILYKDPSSYNRVSIRLLPNDLSNTLAYIEKVWQPYNLMDSPFNYQFIDDRFDRLYRAEENTRTLFSYFMMLALSIAILGLFAISAFVIQQRIKEIGIRKVNGATVAEILSMLNVNFVKWVAIAFVIACPIAYYAMNKWLQNFAYKTELSWWIFALAGFSALGIALMTVSYQSWKAATRNPVEALRYE
ncbi:ABC transporter permease [Labilibacter marinus]|uniref:ABC transporter permease n=1 Tax=Labilibacter marinus TaxID=1477105 RepID=UPI00082C822E|nr:ABC transporter permease [Labilibacter marinus]